MVIEATSRWAPGSRSGTVQEATSATVEQRPYIEIGETSPWWLKRVERDADLLQVFLAEHARANRGPLALGGICREFRRFADSRPDVERLSRDRLYGALVYLALSGRVHIYGDAADITTNTMFQALTSADQEQVPRKP